MTREEKIDLWEKTMGLKTDTDNVENLFDVGKPCNKLAERIYEARRRLLKELCATENRDLDEILICEEDICMLVSLRMYDYGRDEGR